jgi:hypothetical protein
MKSFKTDYRADYAEMFEAVPEFAGQKIPRGTSVVLVGDKIRPAQGGEVPFGVISSYPIMLGNSGGVEWTGKYMRDEFGNYITEDVDVWYIRRKNGTENGIVSNGNVPKGASIVRKKRKILSKDYDPNKEYVQRGVRPEWNMVALLGKVKILKDQPVAGHWIKMKEVSENVEEWLIR